ncbi:MAG: hypothetical protein ACHRHE_06450 [Tepidisphaerales bacterium]
MLTPLYNFFAEIPWYIPATLLLGGAVMWWTGNARLDRKMKRAGAAAFLAALLLMLVSWLLVSDRERVMGQTRQLVKAVEARDWAGAGLNMHPRVIAFSVHGREDVIDAMRLGAEWIELKSATITNLSTRPENSGLTVVLQVFSTAKSEASVPTSWELNWEFIDGRWQLVEIRGLDGSLVRASDLAAWLERRMGH